MITKLSTFKGTSPDGEPLVSVFHKGDSITKKAGGMMPEIQDWLSAYTPDKENIAILVNALGASEYYGINSNGDWFSWGSLAHDCRSHDGQGHPIDSFTGKVLPPYGYWTFMSANAFIHHQNKDPSRAFGVVPLAVLNKAMRRVELVVLVNRKKAMEHGAQEVVDRLDSGERADVSMGTRVPYDTCLICHKKSKTRNDYCFPPGTLVSMVDGSQRCIESIKVGDEVLSSTGSSTKVTALMSRKVEEDLVEIRHTINGIPLLCTGNHPILSSHRESFSCYYVHNTDASRTCFPGATQWCTECRKPKVNPHFVDAEDLRVGDSVYSPSILDVSPTELDGFSAYMVGLFEAEGCFAKRKGKRSSVAFSISSEETDLLESIHKFAARFDREARVYKGSGKGLDIRVNSVKAAEFLFKHAGEYAHQKFASREITSLPSDILSRYIDGLWDGDGHISNKKPGYSRLNTASLSLAFQTSFLLRKLGYTSYLGRALSAGGPGNRSNTHDQWYINTSYGFLSPLKRHSLEDGGMEVGYVKSVDRIPYSGPVYNFETEDHTYVASGISVHNCNCIKSLGLTSILPDGRVVGVDNPHPKFFDISFVFIGADKTAKVMMKLGSGLVVPSSVIDAEILYGMNYEDEDFDKLASGCSTKCGVCPNRSQCDKFTKLASVKKAGVHNIVQRYLKGTSVGKRTTRLLDSSGDVLRHRTAPISTGDFAMKKTSSFTSNIGQLSHLSDDAYYAYRLANGLHAKESPDSVKRDIAKVIKSLEAIKTASLELGPPPSPNRKEYPFVGTLNYRGLTIHVENAKGSYREGTDSGGHKWKTLMRHHYGEIIGTRGTDGDKLDVYVGPSSTSDDVYIVHQNNPKTGKFDEDKAMLGFNSPDHAKEEYLKQYDNPDFFRSLTIMPFDDFKKYIMGEVRGEKVASNVKALGLTSAVGALLGAGAGAVASPDNEGRRGALIGAATGAVAAPVGLHAGTNLARQINMYRARKLGAEVVRKANDALRESRYRFEDATKAYEASLGRGRADFTIDFEAISDLDRAALDLKSSQFDATMAEVTKDAYSNIYEHGNKGVSSAVGSIPLAAAALSPVTSGALSVNLFPKKKNLHEQELLSKKAACALLKVSALKKAEQGKLAEIIKEIEPDGDVGQVAKVLSDREHDLPKSVLDTLGESPGLGPLSTPSAMGIMLKPREFQRVFLVSCGQKGIADHFDSRNTVFSPSEGEEPMSGDLGPKHFDRSVFQMLAPFMGSRSYFEPIVRKRIIMIKVTPKSDSPKEESSPLLDKVANVYNWYRKEVVKVAQEVSNSIDQYPSIHAALYGITDDSDFFKEGAQITPAAAALGSIPVTLLYSAHLRDKKNQGYNLGSLEKVVSEYPLLASLGGAVGLNKVMSLGAVKDVLK